MTKDRQDGDEGEWKNAEQRSEAKQEDRGTEREDRENNLEHDSTQNDISNRRFEKRSRKAL
jgi:hypothetical protein